MELGLQVFGDPPDLHGLSYGTIHSNPTDMILDMVFRLVDRNDSTACAFCFTFIPTWIGSDNTNYIAAKIITRFEDADVRMHFNDEHKISYLLSVTCVVEAMHARRRKKRRFYIYNDKKATRTDLLDLIVDTGGQAQGKRFRERLCDFFTPDADDPEEVEYSW